MKKFVCLSILAIFACAIVAEADVPFVIQPGHYVWHMWDHVYKYDTQAYPTPDDFFLKTVALRNKLEPNYESFRHLQAGQTIWLPDAPGSDAVNLKKENESLKNQIKTQAEDIEKKVVQPLREENDKLKEQLKSVASPWLKDIKTWLLLILLVVTVVVAVKHFQNNKKLRRSLLILERQKIKLDEQRMEYEATLDEFLHKYQLPNGLAMRTTAGDRGYVYFQRANQINGKEAVYVRGIQDPVMVENLKGTLNNSADKILSQNHLYRVTTRVREEVIA